MKKDYNRYCHSLLRIEEVPFLFVFVCRPSALSNISGVYCKNNTIVLTNSGSDGRCYVCFTFLEGEGISQGKYITGIYDEYDPDIAVINEEVTTENEFRKWFNITDLLDNSFIHRSRIKKDNGIAMGLATDAFEKDYVEVILSGDEQFDEQIILYFDGRKEIKQLTDEL